MTLPHCDQQLAESFVQALKATAQKQKHHVEAMEYFQAQRVTLKNWALVPGILHSICGAKQQQCCFPVPLKKEFLPREFLRGPGKVVKVFGNVCRRLPTVEDIITEHKNSSMAAVELLPGIWCMRQWRSSGPLRPMEVGHLAEMLSVGSDEESLKSIWRRSECGILVHQQVPAVHDK